eukprot:454768-Pyramimonas_sp.AAC.1
MPAIPQNRFPKYATLPSTPSKQIRHPIETAHYREPVVQPYLRMPAKTGAALVAHRPQNCAAHAS